MPRRDQTDMMNAPIRRAIELSVLGLRRFMEDNPNPVGYIPANEQPSRLTRADLNRLLGKR